MNYAIPRPAWLGVLAISLMLFAIPTSYATTYNDCFNAYDDSDAYDECDTTYLNIFVNSDDKCEIAATCPKDDGTNWRSGITVTVDEADDVENCDGVLSLSCN